MGDTQHPTIPAIARHLRDGGQIEHRTQDGTWELQPHWRHTDWEGPIETFDPTRWRFALTVEDQDAFDFDNEPEPTLDAYRVNGMLKALAREQRRLDEFDAIAERELEELEDRIKRQREAVARPVRWLLSALELAHAAKLAEDPTLTKWTLPAGGLTSKAGPVQWEITDYNALLAWCGANLPDAVRTPKPRPLEVDRNSLKKLLGPHAVTGSPQAPKRADGLVVSGDGEVVPGLTVVATPRTFHPKPYAHEVTGSETRAVES